MSPEITSRRIREQAVDSDWKPSNRLQELAVTSLRLHTICVVMSLLSAFIFTLTEHDDHEQSLWCTLEIAMQTLVVIMATYYFRRRIAVLHESPVIMPMLIVVASLSLICEPFQRLMLGTGHPFEILIMHSSCNLMLALAVCGFRMSFQRLAALIAVFLTIFCCTISSAPGLIPLVILFSIAAIAWLVAAWWETVDRRIVEAEQKRMPLRWLAVGVAMPLLILVTADSFGSNTVTTALRGFMPSSGGAGEYSEFSRGGVNDGDALVAGDENIRSFAPLDDAPFLDSDKPSLYDVFNDTYDDAKVNRNQVERAISLPADMLKHIHQLMAEAKQAGREFSLQRTEKKSDSRRIHDLNTKAIFYVAGRTPLHLRMQVYELFDGVDWSPSPEKASDFVATIRKTNDRDWLKIPQPGESLDVFSGTATHSIKVANIDGNTIPLPAHPVGVSIDKVDRADMYQVDANGLVSLSRKSIPSMVPVSVVSHCVDWASLSDNTGLSVIRRTEVTSMDSINVMLPSGQDIERIRALAEEWTSGLPRGWKQVDAIRSRLRAGYVLDRSSHASSDASALQQFLIDTRRGPEYLFASSAAVMLRTLGYQARLVSGFYARPEKYDSHKRHTVVEASDAHFWCEVFVGSGTWLAVEASPGYALLSPPLGILERLAVLVQLFWNACVEHRFWIGSAAVLLTCVFVSRRTIQNALLTLRWRLTDSTTPERKAISLAVLIDHRLRLTGLERNAGTTLKRWARQEELKPVRNELSRVAEMADQAAFGCPAPDQFCAGELDELASHLSYRRLRTIKQESFATTN